MSRRSIAVLGLGNVLLGDDAFGPTVVELLRARYEFAAEPPVTLLDVGTPGLTLPAHLAGHDAVILVDSVADAGAAGEVRLYRRADLDRLPPKRTPVPTTRRCRKVSGSRTSAATVRPRPCSSAPSARVPTSANR